MSRFLNVRSFVISVIVLCFLLSSSPLYGLGEVGEVNPLGVVKLAINAQTAMVKERDIEKGLKKIAQKTFDDEFTWKYVIGNYEQLITQNAEAEIPKFKKKLMGWYDNLKKFSDAIKQLHEGKIEQGVITGLDLIVGQFEHPLIKLTWEVSKFAYESHKAVVETGMALDIEALYGVVNRDRLLAGVSAEDSQPKLIPVTDRNVEYFYNKYLIVNDDVRRMMISYVQKKFPGQYVLDDVMLVKGIDSLVYDTDMERAKQVERVTKHKSDALKWIAALLNDLNLQVKASWARARLRQQMVGFDEFLVKFHGITSDENMDKLLQEFLDRKKFEAESKDYPQYLSNSKKERDRVRGEAEKLKATEVSRATEFTSLAMEWHHKLRKASARAYTITKLQLSEDLEKEMYEWDKLRDSISQRFKEKTSTIGDEAFKEIYTPHSANPTYALIDDTYLALFKPLLKPYQWPVDPETVKEQMLDTLQRGDFRKASEIIYKWQTTSMAEKEEESLWAHYQKISTDMYKLWENTRKPLAEELAKVYAACSAMSPNAQCFREQYDPLYKRVVGLDGAITFSQCTYGFPECALSSLSATQYTLFASTTQWLGDTYNAFEALRDQRIRELSELRRGLGRFEANLPFPPADRPWEVEQMDRELEKVKTDTWIAVSKEWVDADKVGNVGNILGIIGQKAFTLEQWKYLGDSIDTYGRVVSDLELKWTIAAKETKAFLDGVQLTQSDFDEFTVLADRSFTREEIGRYARMAAQVPSIISALKERYRQFMTLADTQLTNTSRDADWLREIAREFQRWINTQVKNGVLYEYMGTYGLSVHENVSGRMAYGTLPHPHFRTKDEMDKVTREGQQLKVYNFVKTYMPRSLPVLESLLEFKGVLAAKEENFTLPDRTAIYRSHLNKAGNLVAAFKPDLGHIEYTDRLKEIAALLPYTVDLYDYVEDLRRQSVAKMLGTTYTSVPQEGRLYDVDASKLNFSLGETYLDVRKKLAALIEARKSFLARERERQAAEWQVEQEFEATFGSILGKVNRGLGLAKEYDSKGDYEAVLRLEYYLGEVRREYESMGKKHERVDRAIGEYASLLETAKRKMTEVDGTAKQAIDNLYNQFKQAYESRNDAQLVSCLSKDWHAGDGTTIGDLQANLKRTFRVFDEIRCDIKNLDVKRAGNDRYTVTYDLTLTSRIYKRNLKHEEQSSLSEEVVFDDSKKPRINKTLGGRFWQPQ
jgi:hypothetical protein